MGPAQVLLSLLSAKIVKRIWPNTLIVAGGTHITARQSSIARDARYGLYIDAYLPGHSESTFVNLIREWKNSRTFNLPGVLIAGNKFCKDEKQSLV